MFFENYFSWGMLIRKIRHRSQFLLASKYAYLATNLFATDIKFASFSMFNNL